MRSDILTIRARVEKRVNLLLQHAVLDGVEELLRLRERQTQMLNASVVFLQGDDIGDGFFLAIIIINNELKFDAHGACSSSSGGGNGFDHGVGHSLLLLYDTKTPRGQKIKKFNGLGDAPFNASISLF